jgi:hypothetical protein
MVNVLANLLFGCPAHFGAKVAARPDVLPPARLFQVGNSFCKRRDEVPFRFCATSVGPTLRR